MEKKKINLNRVRVNKLKWKKMNLSSQEIFIQDLNVNFSISLPHISTEQLCNKTFSVLASSIIPQIKKSNQLPYFVSIKIGSFEEEKNIFLAKCSKIQVHKPLFSKLARKTMPKKRYILDFCDEQRCYRLDLDIFFFKRKSSAGIKELKDQVREDISKQIKNLNKSIFDLILTKNILSILYVRLKKKYPIFLLTLNCCKEITPK